MLPTIIRHQTGILDILKPKRKKLKRVHFRDKSVTYKNYISNRVLSRMKNCVQAMLIMYFFEGHMSDNRMISWGFSQFCTSDTNIRGKIIV